MSVHLTRGLCGSIHGGSFMELGVNETEMGYQKVPGIED